MLRFYWLLVRWCQEGANVAWRNGGRHFIAFRFVELSSVCLLAMSATEHRITTPSNVLPISLAVSLLIASRMRAPHGHGHRVWSDLYRPGRIAPSIARQFRTFRVRGIGD
jgi:hypothetical protein